MDEEENKTHCSQCGKVIEDKPWYCYYADQYSSDNLLCGNGDCWAGWMQNNTCQIGDY